MSLFDAPIQRVDIFPGKLGYVSIDLILLNYGIFLFLT